VTALKVAEDSPALVLRALEMEGRADRLDLPGGAVDVPPRGIVSVMLGADRVRPCNGLER